MVKKVFFKEWQNTQFLYLFTCLKCNFETRFTLKRYITFTILDKQEHLIKATQFKMKSWPENLPKLLQKCAVILKW